MRHALHLFAVLLSLMLISSSAFGQADRLTIATYNLENAFDVFDNPYTEDEGTDVKERWQLEAIAKAVLATNADIIAFQEVENEPLLRSLADEFLADQGYEHISVMPSNDGRGICLGVISRLPIRSVTSYRWQTLSLPGDQRVWRFARDLMHVQIDISGPDAKPLHVFVVHFKSKRSVPGDENANAWRTAEATRTRQIIEKLLAEDPEAWAVVTGDFNSNPTDAAMTALLTPGDDGSHPLTDLHAKLPAEQRITFPSTTYPNTIFDYILASPAMAKRVVPGTAGLVTDSKLTRGSDHLPVYASFDMK